MLPFKRIFAIVTLFVFCGCSQVAKTQREAPSGPIDPASDKNFSHHSGETNYVTLSVTMRKSVNMDDPIYIDFKLQNDHNGSIILNHSEDAGDIYMTLKTDRLEVVQLTDYGKRYDSAPPYRFYRNLPFPLRPHGVLTWRYNLRDYFKITHAGGYELSALRTVDGIDGSELNGGGKDEEVNVGPIRFKVRDGND